MYQPVSTSEGGGLGAGKIAGGCVCCLVLLFGGLYFGLVHVITGMATDGFITIHDKWQDEFCMKPYGEWNFSTMVENNGWPGCGLVKDGDFSSCKGDCIKAETMKKIDAFNAKWGGKKVAYKSRQGKGEDGKQLERIELTGWWLPAPNAKKGTPRLVLQHGFTSNGNKHREVFLAYQLRKMGFSVLVNNLRDHCYSDNSKTRVVEWGHAYPYDTLGAWDYAVNDPDSVLGLGQWFGATSDSNVGIIGMSMGAFLTSTVFGLEGRVPAVWVDAPPFTPESAFNFGSGNTLAGMGLGFLSNIINPPVWSNLEKAALANGVDLQENTPEKTMPTGPDTNRKMFWVGNKDDTTVDFNDGYKMEALVKKYPTKYTLVEKWELKGKCNGEDHCADHVRIPAEYEAKLCSYWTGVFGLHVSSCNLEFLQYL